MAPTVTLSLTTLAEVLFASVFVAGVIFISKKDSKVAGNESKAGEGKGKKKKSKAAVKDVGMVKEVKVAAEKMVDKVVEKVETVKKAKKEKKAVAPVPVVVPTPVADVPSFAAVVAPTPAPPTKPAQTNKKTAAEARRKVAPVTAVDDMRDLELDPEVKIARVIKVVELDTKAQEEEDAKWQAWKEEEEDDGEWEVQKVKKPTTSSIVRPASSFSSAPTTRSIPGLSTTTPSAKNAKKTSRAADAKAEAEREQQARLKIHRAGLERARMEEQEKERNKSKPKVGPRSEQVSAKPPTALPRLAPTPKSTTSGNGMRAAIDSNGALIWE